MTLIIIKDESLIPIFYFLANRRMENFKFHLNYFVTFFDRLLSCWT